MKKESIYLDRYDPNKKQVVCWVDAKVKEKLKKQAKHHGLLLKNYLNKVLTNVARSEV